MNNSLSGRFADRLPLFIHVYFGLIVISGFRRLAELLAWTTAPRFDISEPSNILVPLSFIFALFWIVTDWLAYSWLIVTQPYSGRLFDLSRFFLDVFLFSFLVGEVKHYEWFIFGVALWHGVIALWHILVLKISDPAPSNEQRRARVSDATWHAWRLFIFLVLGLLYLFLVSSDMSMTYYILVFSTFILIALFNTHRVFQLRRQILGIGRAPKSLRGLLGI